MKRLVLASANRGKLAEFGALFAGFGVELVSLADLGLPSPEETGASFVENALLKARHAAGASGLPALGDDSGLCVDALGGAPGLYSARYAGPDGDARANIARLLDALDGIEPARRGAHFHCSLVLVAGLGDPAPRVFQGDWHGSILDAPRGDQGFGYDPVFLDPASGLSAAELAPADKHRASHRGRAVSALRQALAEGGLLA